MLRVSKTSTDATGLAYFACHTELTYLAQIPTAIDIKRSYASVT
jgi:hypothetical protein